MTKQEIKNIIQKGENIAIGFKESKNKLPKTLFETVCSFLNTDGGTILLGVDDNGKITGINPNNIGQLKKDIANLANNTEKFHPVYFLQINELTDRQKEILKLIVSDNRISRKKISEIMKINTSAVQKHINTLVEKRIITRIGRTRGYWKILVKPENNNQNN